jgi:hypothetical protein
LPIPYQTGVSSWNGRIKEIYVSQTGIKYTKDNRRGRFRNGLLSTTPIAWPFCSVNERKRVIKPTVMNTSGNESFALLLSGDRRALER